MRLILIFQKKISVFVTFLGIKPQKYFSDKSELIYEMPLFDTKKELFSVSDKDHLKHQKSFELFLCSSFCSSTDFNSL